LPLSLLLPWAWKRTRQPAGDWSRVCDPHLLRWLSVKQSNGERRGGGQWLAGLALLIVILALSGPSWQKLPDASYSARDARVVVLDLSHSMLAEDLRPNRLTRARFRLADLLENTEEGQVGLVAYAGDAYIVSPLTNDMNTIANLLPALRPDIVPVAGSRADLALAMAASLLERSGLARGEILLVTDSVSSRDAAKARDLRDDGIVTSVLAVGTGKGAPIPSGGGFVSDRGGNVVIARMERAELKALADAGGGAYTELGADANGSDLWGILEGSEFTKRDDALGERWKDAGPWLVLLLIPLVLAGFRRGLFFVVPLILVNGLVLPQDARADWWEDLWQRKDQQAYQALREENPQKAAALAVDPDLAGEAWYRTGEYPNAQQSWSLLDSADAHYNRGNALAQSGDLDGAIAAYDRALELEPDMLDAVYNRNIVEQLKQEQEQQGDQGETGESEQSDEEQEGEQSEEQQGEEGEESDSSEEQQSEQESEGEQSEQQQVDYSEAWSEEDAQAMEQWLRRIPDDPGGLLRRKFRYQHQRRGAPEDENESW
jgi:Ca-activated chloride channel family protein